MGNETKQQQLDIEPGKSQQLKTDQTKYIKKLKYVKNPLEIFLGIFSVCIILIICVGLLIHITELRETKYKNGAEIAELHRNQTDMMTWIASLLDHLAIRSSNDTESEIQEYKESMKLLTINHQLRETQSEYISEINDLWLAKSNNLRQIDELQANRSDNLETMNLQRSNILQLQDVVEGLTEMISNLEADTTTTSVLAIAPVIEPTSAPASTSATTQYQDCAEHFDGGNTQDGVYTIYPGGNPVDVFCDMSSNGSIMLQKRYDGSLNFSQTFEQYANGFGNLTAEHWLGLNHVYRITETGNWTLRIDLEMFDNVTSYAEYNQFKIGAEPGFQLLYDGWSYVGTGENVGVHNLRFQRGCKFTTRDVDQDAMTDYNCANAYGGAGWWYNGQGYCARITTTGMPYNRVISPIYPGWAVTIGLKAVTLKIKKT